MSRKIIVSEKGQVTLPKDIRDSIGITPGTVLVFSIRGGEIIAKKDLSNTKGSRWRGRGKLPVGKNVDQYLTSIRDDDGRR